MATTVDERPAGAPAARGGWSWRRLLIVATVATILGLIFLFVVAGIIPPLVVFAVLLLVGVFLLRAQEKWAGILLLVVHLAMLLLSMPFTIPTLKVPASAGDFILTIFLAILNVVGIVAALAVIRRRGEPASGAARTVGVVTLLLILVASAFSIYSTVTYDNATAQEGDVELVTEDTDFSDTSLTADEGTVSVFVDNKDGTYHTFTIEGGPEVDLAIPAGKTARVTFEAEPGSYKFYCIPHEGEMEGNLTVE